MDETRKNPNEDDTLADTPDAGDQADSVESAPPTESAFHDGPVGPAEPLHDADAEQWERSYTMWIHLGALIAWVLVALPSVAIAGVGFLTPILVALIMWMVRKSDSPFVDDHGREATNFQISLILLGLIMAALGLPTCGLTWVLGGIAVSILAIVGTIMGAVAASRGQYFRYPATIRFIRS